MEKVITITDKTQKISDYLYWKSKRPAERIEALEFLRDQYIQSQNVDKGFQRVFRIIEQQQG